MATDASPASTQTDPAASQSSGGDTPSRKPPIAGPAANPTDHDSADTAM